MNSNLLARLLPMFPGILAVISVLVICVAVLLLITLQKARKKGGREAAAEAPKRAAGGQAEGRTRADLALLPRAFDLRVSFLRALKYMRANISGRDHRYQAPWLMLVGESGSGKTTLLNESDLASLGERLDFNVEHSVGWRFFDQGIVLDVPGEYFLRAERSMGGERKWQQLLGLLQKYRPRRPIDGIVLTLPCADFLLERPPGLAVLGEKASFIYERLWRTQKRLGLCLPVYVIVTQCDLIRGFKGFCAQLPAGRRREIFGWSSPYHLEAAFAPHWVDEAFENLAKNLHWLQSEAFLEMQDSRDRDDVFLFPTQFQALRAPLKFFLSQLFKQTAYRESFHFRGLYFCGNTQTESGDAVLALPALELQLEQVPASEPEPAIVHPAIPVETSSKAPIFLTHLFQEKIFPESGLARPYSREFISRNRTTVVSQVLALSLAVILGLGLWISYRRLSMERRSRLLPMLQLIAADRDRLQKAPKLRAANFSNDAYDLLYSMGSLGRWGYRAAFMPGSWFSHINRRIAAAMVPAFEFEILKTFRIELEHRAWKATGFTAPAQPAVNMDLADPPHPDASQFVAVTQTPEYQRLQRFTQSLTTLQENIDRYDVLAQPQQGEPKDLRLLVDYLNDRALPANFDYEGNQLFRSALKNSQGQPFIYRRADQQRATAEMERLVADLFNSWVAQNVVSVRVDSLEQRIAGLQQGQAQTYQDFQNLLSSITEVEVLLSNPDFAWIGSSEFKLTGPVYAVTEGAIQKSKFFTPDLQGWIRENWQNAFQKLWANLSAQGTDLTGPLLQWTGGKVQLSPDVTKLQLALGNVMNLPFMVSEPEGTMRMHLVPGTSLMWDAGLLQQAAGLRESYDRFVQGGLQDCPAAIKQALRHIALSRLEQNTLGLIGQAQSFRPRPKSIAQFSLQQDVLPEASSFQAAIQPLEQLLNDFQALGFEAPRAGLLRLTTRQAVELLGAMDHNFSAGEPYVVKGGNFSWWNGQTSPSMGAFDATRSNGIAGYLAFQQQRVRSYAQRAASLITFLTDMGFPGRSQAEARVFNKWKQIILAVNQYDAKIPGNSVAALNDFISSGMDKITPQNDCQAGSGTVSMESGSDYFLQVRDSLQRDLERRCIEIADETAYQNYTYLATLFNQTMGGRFPFCPVAQEQSSDEADPQSIQAFYRLFNQKAAATLLVLKKTDAFGSTVKPALEFLDQMERLRPVFASFLPGGVGAEVPIFDFVPYFRVNRSQEVGGNQILGWKLVVGGEQFGYHNPTPVHPGRWQWGEPIALQLRWAVDSPLVPSSQGAEPNPVVNGREVTYHYNDPWSLFTLLLSRQAPAVVFPRFADPNPYTLEFTVPTAQALAEVQKQGMAAPPAARVFIRVNIMLPGKSQVLLLPGFPAEAPLLEASGG